MATDTLNPEEQEAGVLEAIDAIRPALQADGGDIVFKRIDEDGVVFVELVGACGTCPVSTMTLKAGVERIIMDRVPGITAVEEDIPVVWVVMNNFAFGTIAGLQKAHYGTTTGTVFRKDGKPYQADFAAVAKAYGMDGVRITSAAEFKPALERAVQSGKPFLIDVAMKNNPVPTTGHWNILDIYSPEGNVSHVSTD